MRLMIFIMEVWSGLCKLTTYQLLDPLMSFGPIQRGPTYTAVKNIYYIKFNY